MPARPGAIKFRHQAAPGACRSRSGVAAGRRAAIGGRRIAEPDVRGQIFLFRHATRTGEVRWGKMPVISQYVLIFIAVTFTWLMGLMGYVRSGLRQHWHVYGVIRDRSPDAFTPTLGFVTQVVSVTVLLFFALIGFVFWITSLHDRPDFERRSRVREGAGEVTPELPGGTSAHT